MMVSILEIILSSKGCPILDMSVAVLELIRPVRAPGL